MSIDTASDDPARICDREHVVSVLVAGTGTAPPGTGRTDRALLRHQRSGSYQVTIVSARRAYTSSRRTPAGGSGSGHARAVSYHEGQARVRRQDAPSLPELGYGSGHRHTGKTKIRTVTSTILRKCYHAPLTSAAAFAGEAFLTGGTEPERGNITNPLTRSLAGGTGLPPLDTSRLRVTWLAEVAQILGLATFLHAAGITCCQHLGDITAGLDPGSQDGAIALLGGRTR
jgi:hypothetical protein